MSNTQFFWSERARMEFAALFDDGDHSASFRDAVARALAKGWGGNRDKPFWAMALLVATLGEQTDTGGDDEGMELLWNSPGEILHLLNEVALDESNERITRTSDGLFLNAPDGRLKLSLMRIAILAKLAEFLLACNEFGHSADVMQALAAISQSGHEAPKEVREGGRALARIAYKYRAEHFLDAHSASSFSIIKKYLTDRSDYTVDDETLFAFWVWPNNMHYKTYQAVYFAFLDFGAALREARIIEASSSSMQLDDPVIAGELAAIDEQIYDASGEQLPPKERMELLNKSELKLFKHREIALIGQLLECDGFGLEHMISSLRLISFNAVQSGISNGLRTGNAKLPLEQRVRCEEARTYTQLQADLRQLEDKAQGWLKVALALRSKDDDDADSNENRLQQQGVHILRRSRAKSLNRPIEELRPLFEQMEETLICCARQTGAFNKKLKNCFGDNEERMQRRFLRDKELFAAEFQRRYLDEPHS